MSEFSAQDLVRNPRLWKELAEVLRIQATQFDRVADAIENNNLEALNAAFAGLVELVAKRQPVLEQLAPAMNTLIQEALK